MATTACVAWIWQEEVIIVNIGDSRGYVYGPTGKLVTVTLDDSGYKPTGNPHTFSQAKLAEIQAIQSRLSECTDTELLNAVDRRRFATRNQIAQALGGPANKLTGFPLPVPGVYIADWRYGSRLVLTTDGVSDNMTDSEIQEISGATANPAKALVEAAEARSDEFHDRAKPDDMTAIVVKRC